MCGIVAAIAQRPVVEILLEGLRRLEYRGYDSAGVAVIEGDGTLTRQRTVGKVASLEQRLTEQPVNGMIGIAHTRWATHGKPVEQNAHPHFSHQRVAVVHNGIIENHDKLRQALIVKGYEFQSETDTEVIAHTIKHFMNAGSDLLDAVKQSCKMFTGAYALAIMSADEPDKLIIAREGSPLLIGLGFAEHFAASDVQALLPVTNRFIYLENGDTAELSLKSVRIFDEHDNLVERPVVESKASDLSTELGDYRHYMQKEIFEQPNAIAATMEGRISADRILPCISGMADLGQLSAVENIQIIACGTSYHAGLLAKYWIEEYVDIPCAVEVASEYRYRHQATKPNQLVITISQSGETADTLSALQKVKADDACIHSLTICNVAESSLTRESDMALMTVAGAEIGVASTKAFTTQLVAILLLLGLLAQAKNQHRLAQADLINQLKQLPELMNAVLALDPQIQALAEDFIEKNHTLFLGRGEQFPVALEGALKLKEISYIHAEAYPAGELKHGPLALVDSEMPIVAVAPKTGLLEKLLSNLEEVRSRGGQLYVFADETAEIQPQEQLHVIPLPACPTLLAPIVYSVPLQLLAYHVSVLKGTDVDKPRNLAKSVTVE